MGMEGDNELVVVEGCSGNTLLVCMGSLLRGVIRIFKDNWFL